jgi:hypothetical protein
MLKKEIYPFYYDKIKYNSPFSFIKAMSSYNNNERHNISIMSLDLLDKYIIVNYKKSFNDNYKKIVEYALRVKYSQPKEDILKDIKTIEDKLQLEILNNMKNEDCLIEPIKNIFMKENKKFKTTLINRHKFNSFDQYIGRGTIFGNPNSQISNDYISSKEEAIEAYRYDFNKRIREDKNFKLAVLNLRGQVLACSCKPSACHGDIIVEYLDGIKDINLEIIKTKKRV